MFSEKPSSVSRQPPSSLYRPNLAFNNVFISSALEALLLLIKKTSRTFSTILQSPRNWIVAAFMPKEVFPPPQYMYLLTINLVPLNSHGPSVEKPPIDDDDEIFDAEPLSPIFHIEHPVARIYAVPPTVYCG